MKKIIFFLITLLPLTTLAQQAYVIKGTWKKTKNYTTACIFYKLGDKAVLDTAVIKNGEFVIKGTVPYPMKATVFFRPWRYSWFKDPARLDQVDVYLETGNITVNVVDSMKNAVIGGTQLNIDYRDMVKLLAPFNTEEAALKMAKRRAEDINNDMDIVQAAYKELADREVPAREAFISSHLNSLVGMELLTTTIDPAFNLNKAKTYFNKFPKSLQQSMLGKTYSNLFNVALGCQAPDFTAKNTKGEEVSISSYKGKYVLLDFWASWCMPCRADNPHVKKLYEQYKNQNFTVLGVSVDQGEIGKKYWIKAIDMDHISWDQISELKGFKGSGPALYGITAVPTNFLIDPSGKIIAKNLRGAALDDKLTELFSKPDKL